MPTDCALPGVLRVARALSCRWRRLVTAGLRVCEGVQQSALSSTAHKRVPQRIGLSRHVALDFVGEELSSLWRSPLQLKPLHSVL